MKIEIYVNEDIIVDLKLNRDSIEDKDEDTNQEMSDITGMRDSDIDIAALEIDGTRFEISTTNNKYNLYLFEDNKTEDGFWQTIGVTNISDDIDMIEGYQSICIYLTNLI